MSAIGPELPPHLLAKRKRQQEEVAKDNDSTSSGAKRSPSLPDNDKRRRVAGPTMPSAPLAEKPDANDNLQRQETSDESSDDEIGPALPQSNENVTEDYQGSQRTSTAAAEAITAVKRDEWMTLAPSHDGLSRIDPSKPRPRAFNTGKGAKDASASGVDSTAWHETPEEKRRRLENEMMGVSYSKDTASGTSVAMEIKKSKQQEKARKVKEEVDLTRGPSLMDQHSNQKKRKDDDDDPSQRAFDRDKDMSIGGISASQRKRMLNHASSFTSRFQSGT